MLEAAAGKDLHEVVATAIVNTVQFTSRRSKTFFFGSELFWGVLFPNGVQKYNSSTNFKDVARKFVNQRARRSQGAPPGTLKNDPGRSGKFGRRVSKFSRPIFRHFYDHFPGFFSSPDLFRSGFSVSGPGASPKGYSFMIFAEVYRRVAL